MKELRKVKIDEIIPYPNNPRLNDDAVEAVAESIKQCSYIAPIIVDEDMVILAGHTRYKALKKLRRKECEILVQSGLTDPKISTLARGEVNGWTRRKGRFVSRECSCSNDAGGS